MTLRRALGAQMLDGLVVQEAVRGHEAPFGGRLGAVEGRAAATRLLDEQLHGDVVPHLHHGIARNLECALGNEAVLPEVAEPAVRPRPLHDRPPPLGHAPRARRRHGGVLDPRDERDPATDPGRERPCAAERPPPPPERRSGDQRDVDDAVTLQRQQRRPHRHATDEVRRAVDRVDDPLRIAAVVAELLAEHALPAARGRDPLTDHLLGAAVGLRDGREVRLGVDAQVGRAKARRRDRVSGVRECVREAKVVVHAREATVRRRSVASQGATAASQEPGVRRALDRRRRLEPRNQHLVLRLPARRPRRDRIARAGRARRVGADRDDLLPPHPAGCADRSLGPQTDHGGVRRRARGGVREPCARARVRRLPSLARAARSVRRGLPGHAVRAVGVRRGAAGGRTRAAARGGRAQREPHAGAERDRAADRRRAALRRPRTPIRGRRGVLPRLAARDRHAANAAARAARRGRRDGRRHVRGRPLALAARVPAGAPRLDEPANARLRRDRARDRRPRARSRGHLGPARRAVRDHERRRPRRCLCDAAPVAERLPHPARPRLLLGLRGRDLPPARGRFAVRDRRHRGDPVLPRPGGRLAALLHDRSRGARPSAGPHHGGGDPGRRTAGAGRPARGGAPARGARRTAHNPPLRRLPRPARDRGLATLERMASTAQEVTRRGLFLAGEWVETGEWDDVLSPYSGELVGRVARGGAEHTRAAIDAAVRAMRTPLPAHERAAILDRIAAVLAERVEEAAQLICAEAGKPIKVARGEAERAVETYPAAAVAARALTGEAVPMDASPAGEGKLAFTLRVPVGVVGAISPFNFPLNLVAHKLAPALAAGCAVVLKPAPATPLTALFLAELSTQAGLPAGWLNVVCGPAAEIGDVLVEDERVKAITFTGSGPVGWSLRERAPRKRVLLELGNSTPMIVAADGDLDAAAAAASRYAFAFSGQACISLQRVFVQRAVYDDFIARLLPKVEELVVGDPADEATDVGPVIDERSRDRILDWIERSGGEVLTGGALTDDGLIAPTVVASPARESQLSCAEAFGPVCTVQPYDTEDEEFELANATPYGLHAGIFTRDISLAVRAARALEFGGVIVNDAPSVRLDHMPYGGVKESGNTREGPAYAVRELTEERLVVIQP